MATKGSATLPNPLHAPSVDGLQHGRRVARRRASRRRLKNTVVSGVLFVTVGGAVGAAGYFGYQFFVEEQNNNSVDRVPTPGRSADEIIEHLEQQPTWNGPGNPTFGVGDEQP